MDDFKNANITPGSKGVILSDYNKTLNGLNDGTSFCSDLFICLIGWKNSGYDVILHTMSTGDGVDGVIRMQSAIHKVDKNFFEPSPDHDFSRDIMIDKNETNDLDAVAIFDDEVLNRKGKTGVSLDVNLPHVRSALHRIATEYEASGRTKILTFNPQDFSPCAPNPTDDPKLVM